MAAVIGIGAAAGSFLAALVGGAAGIALLAFFGAGVFVAGGFLINFVLSHDLLFKGNVKGCLLQCTN